MNNLHSMYDLQKIFEIVLAFNTVTDRTMLLSIILTNMMEITGSDAGTLYIVENGKLHFRIIQNKSLGIFQSFEEHGTDLPPIDLDEDNIENLSAYVAIKNEVVIIDDIYADDQFAFTGHMKYDEITGYKTKAMLVLPICAQRNEGEEVLGVLQLLNPIDPNTNEVGVYSDISNQSTVLALTKVAASTLSNLTHVTDLQMSLRSFAGAMTQAIDERSNYNSRHTQNVAKYCEQFVKWLSRKFKVGHKFYFDAFHIESLTLAALLHDIGKIITPLEIMDKANRLSDKIYAVRYRFELKKWQVKVEHLKGQMDEATYEANIKHLDDLYSFIEQVNSVNFLTDEQFEGVQALKDMQYINIDGQVDNILDPGDIEALSVRRGTLTVSERKIMEQHVNVTTRLLEKIPFRKYYANIPEWAANHHEFLDGTGYPAQLKGSQIPLESCIITIMDIFDALIDTNRPYKKGVPIDKALDILTEMADMGKLHKELVALFVESKVWVNVGRI